MSNVVYLTRDSDAKSTSTARVRSDRFFKLSDYWYFITREGATLGPHDSKSQAQQAVADYIQFVNQATPAMMKLLATR
ncbi:hypothetical protein A9Q89_10095 [Gammaproteobacteria bacterium 53_120_T64]|nr:hypothetical protein A9Q89_10095 [Gammaproteobacteria bacterium 53_120_T64]